MSAEPTKAAPGTAAPTPEFDRYAADYDAALNMGLATSGEQKEYFAEGRMRWLAGRLRELGVRADRVLDFGCGTGASTPYFFDVLGAREMLGVDVSEESLDVARTSYAARPTARFATIGGAAAAAPSGGPFDVAFCNGVFHHIPPGDRLAAVRYVASSLRPGGVFAFWENNPWNPGTRYIMSRVPFDRDAITLTPPESRRLLRAGGLEVLRTDFLFIFPRVLRHLRPLEPALSALPLGGQFMVLCRKA
jgi:SAM-dependent methyltransferase